MQMSPLISDGMVLQRDSSKTGIWGTSAPLSNISVEFLRKEYKTSADEDGYWSVTFGSLPIANSQTLVIRSARLDAPDEPEEIVVLRDVCVGEVWLCSGQSNMEMTVSEITKMFPDVLNSKHEYIREFKIAREVDFTAERQDVTEGQWTLATTPASIGAFSALAYFFAKNIRRELTVPVGIITSAWGGTPIASWVDAETVGRFPELRDEADEYKDELRRELITATELAAVSAFYKAMDRDDEGMQYAWYAKGYDDDDWVQRKLDESWTGNRELLAQGVVWFRHTFDLGNDAIGRNAVLDLGTIVDADTVYLDGVKLGETTHRYAPRLYNFIVKSSKIDIAIRVKSVTGIGGFTEGKTRTLSVDGMRDINLNIKWKFKRGLKTGKVPPETRFHYKATSCFNAMIAPLTRYAVKGALWYQGESDVEQPVRYEQLFNALIKLWRNRWGAEFPFLFVQLPEYLPDSGDWAEFRSVQEKALSLHDTAMAVGLGAGEANDLHPLDKKTLADRLTVAALNIAYGKNAVFEPPKLVDAFFGKGDFTLIFDAPLETRGDVWVSVNHISVPCVASGNVLFVCKLEKSNLFDIRYAWENAPVPTLFGMSGLPVAPFAIKIRG